MTLTLILSAFAALLASFAAAMPAASAAPFVADAAELRRLEDANPRPASADSRKLAMTSDGGAWIGVGTYVWRVSNDGEGVRMAIGDSAWGEVEHVVVDPYDDSVWVATDASRMSSRTAGVKSTPSPTSPSMRTIVGPTMIWSSWK